MVVCHGEEVGQHHQGWGTEAVTSIYPSFYKSVLRASMPKVETIDYRSDSQGGGLNGEHIGNNES
jgi:hypothetical protein